MIQKSRKFLTPLLATAVAFATIIPDASADTPVVSQQANGTVITSPADISSLDTDASGNHAPSVTPDDDQGNAETIPVAGGQQTVFTIDSPESSHIRTFDLGLPDGAIIVERDGFFFVEQDGQITIRISDPWAKDANGNAVNTWFTTDGKTLTQYVEKDESAVYPITVDPRWTWGGCFRTCVFQ
ncbi:hypothetical protein QP027_04780 [Corynebacterium breve]|uniref:Cell surface protein n=1 Tax=Corynebacterium breve TaxID=3049799 RepID=A0ABY8VKI3_9CORY|nr:hypothetical protein [Corynebacterium breve]WIM68704.1 hypothetical protein QP027_04780 [Corynebacterium breve]